MSDSGWQLPVERAAAPSILLRYASTKSLTRERSSRRDPTRQSQVGAKGAGEAGTAGAPDAVMYALNNALVPFGVRVTSQPFTPEKILRALRKV